MRYVFAGNTGVRVSELGMGTMAFGDGADREMSASLFARARDAGINLFDCADVYGKGVSEEWLGEMVAGCRGEVVLATKGYFPTGSDINARGSSRYHLVRAVEASLRRLGTDYIDIYYLHRFDEQTPLEETLRALEDLVQSGKILYPAASNFSAWQAAKGLGIAARHGWSPLACLQPMYNLAKRQAEVEILPMAHAEGLAVFPYSPLGGGLLSGKYAADRRPDAGRLVDNAMYKTRYGDAHYYERAGTFHALALEHGTEPAALAIAWVAHHPAVTAPLIGARKVEHLEVALRSLELTIDEEFRAALDEIWPKPPPATDRNEEGSEHNYGQR